MDFDFGNVLTRAWQIIWKHKILWIFGILAGCARGNGGGSGGGGGETGYQYGPGGDNPLPNDQFLQQFERLNSWIEQNLWIIFAFIAVVILFSLLLYFLGIVGKIGLIRGTYKAERGVERLDFGGLFSDSLPYFWRVFGLAFIIGLAFVLIFIPLILLGVLTAGVGFLCILPLICVLIPVALVVSVVLEQANAAIVLENKKMFDGLRRGWEVVRHNAGVMVIMALILLFGGGIVGVILALPIILAVFPLMFGLMEGQPTRVVWIAGLCIVAYLPVIIVLNGILTAYIQSVWTLTFMRLTVPKENAPVFVEANA
jgi:hypothetical protein